MVKKFVEFEILLQLLDVKIHDAERLGQNPKPFLWKGYRVTLEKIPYEIPTAKDKRYGG